MSRKNQGQPGPLSSILLIMLAGGWYAWWEFRFQPFLHSIHRQVSLSYPVAGALLLLICLVWFVWTRRDMRRLDRKSDHRAFLQGRLLMLCFLLTVGFLMLLFEIWKAWRAMAA